MNRYQGIFAALFYTLMLIWMVLAVAGNNYDRKSYDILWAILSFLMYRNSYEMYKEWRKS